MLFATSREMPDRWAVISGKLRLTYRELAARVAPWVDRFRGLPFHAFTADATVETIVTFWALVEAGVPAVPLHPRLTEGQRESLLQRVRGAPLPPDTCALLFTSGTSAAPKGVLLSREAFVASARASEAHLGWRSDDAWLVCMPMAHVGGLSIPVRCLLGRRPLVLLPRFTPPSVLDAIEFEGASILSLVPTMLAALLDDDSDNRLARARAVIVGGAPCPQRLIDRARERGVSFVSTYGMTESCAMVTLDGNVLPGIELSIHDGTIRLNGPNLFSGYLGEPPRRGPFDTRDLGHFDANGRLVVDGRRSELIITGGENVAPLQVEQALADLPGVRELMVYGIPDETYGQRVAAAIVAEPGFSEERFLEAAAQRLAPFQRPRHLERVAALPRTPAGKLDRRR